MFKTLLDTGLFCWRNVMERFMDRNEKEDFENN